MDINISELHEKNIISLRENTIKICETLAKENFNKEDVLKELNVLLESVKKMQYEDCTVVDFEALVDEELVLDILIDKGNLDIETAKELVLNKEVYILGQYDCKKIVDSILGGLL